MTVRLLHVIDRRCVVMPGFVRGIHGFLCTKDVDGRDEPGHDIILSALRL
jgi:hypothetical protein